VDIGGTKVAMGLVAADGQVSHAMFFPTPPRGPAIVEAVADRAAGLMAKALAAGLGPVRGIGVATGGVVDASTGVVLAASDLLADWANTPVARLLSDRLGLPARIENDGTAFALAESRFGSGRDLPDAVYVAVGTGVGGGLVLGGTVRRGPRHLAGEFGHLPFPTRRRCSCGLIGHLEPEASGPGLTAIYRESTGTGARALQEVAARAQAGDSAAQAVLDAGARALGRALAGPVVAADVPAVVIGGGVGLGLGEGYRELVRSALDAALPHRAATLVLPAAMGSTAAVAGAGSLLF
jgi:glucokinase